MNRIEEQYRGLLGTLLENSTEKNDRTGTGTLSVFGRQIRHNMQDGFPLLTTKKMAVKTMMTELKWFLRGDTNIKYLIDNDCHIWDGDAYKNFVTQVRKQHSKYYEPMPMDHFLFRIKSDDEFAKKWGELGPIYGKQWRSWSNLQINDYGVDTQIIDQIQNLINDLKTNPDSRRLMVSAWNVDQLDQMTLPPCHYGFQCYVRDGKYLSLMWNQRSVDTFLGLPFNIASYATLLCLIAEEVGMIPDQLIGNLGDVHLYKNHIDQAREQISREIYELPTITFSNVNLLGGEFDYEIHNYKYHPSIKAPLSN